MVRLLAALAIVLATHGLGSAVAEDLNATQVQFAFENHSNPDYPNCTLAAFVSSYPAPEFVNVRMRVDGTLQRKLMFFSITTDVGEQLYRDGKPNSIRKVPIDQAEFLADDFDSLGRMHATLDDDGGVQQSTTDAELFPPLLLNFQSGHFTVRFRRVGTDLIRGYAISAKLGATTDASAQFRECMARMLPLFEPK